MGLHVPDDASAARMGSHESGRGQCDQDGVARARTRSVRPDEVPSVLKFGQCGLTECHLSQDDGQRGPGPVMQLELALPGQR